MSKTDNSADGWASPDTGDSNETLVEPGEAYEGEITNVDFSHFEHGYVEIDGNRVSLNSTLRQQLEEALVKGTEVRYVKDEEEQSFEDEEGENVSFHARNFQFRVEDDD